MHSKFLFVETIPNSSTAPFSLIYEVEKNHYPYHRDQFVTTEENFLNLHNQSSKKILLFPKTSPEIN